jgi:hypothetical protein
MTGKEEGATLLGMEPAGLSLLQDMLPLLVLRSQGAVLNLRLSPEQTTWTPVD